MARYVESQRRALLTTQPLTSQAPESHTVANTHPTQFAPEPRYG
jgi:hypothetical protein